MKVFVSRPTDVEGEAPRWRKQVTLPKAWLASPTERLKNFVVKSYNEAHSADQPLDPEEWHLVCEEGGFSEPLGGQDIISEVVLTKDELVLRPGSARAHGGEALRRRADAGAPLEAAMAAVLVNVEMEVLEALRTAVDADSCKDLKEAVERAGLGSPHEVPMAEVELQDSLGNRLGTEWHGLGGRFGWDLAESGPGEAPENRCSLAQYAEQRKASSVRALVELADRCGIRIAGEGGCRSTEEIEASARSVAGMVSELPGRMEGQQA